MNTHTECERNKSQRKRFVIGVTLFNLNNDHNTICFLLAASEQSERVPVFVCAISES